MGALSQLVIKQQLYLGNQSSSEDLFLKGHHLKFDLLKSWEAIMMTSKRIYVVSDSVLKMGKFGPTRVWEDPIGKIYHPWSP